MSRCGRCGRPEGVWKVWRQNTRFAVTGVCQGCAKEIRITTQQSQEAQGGVGPQEPILVALDPELAPGAIIAPPDGSSDTPLAELIGHRMPEERLIQILMQVNGWRRAKAVRHLTPQTERIPLMRGRK